MAEILGQNVLSYLDEHYSNKGDSQSFIYSGKEWWSKFHLFLSIYILETCGLKRREIG